VFTFIPFKFGWRISVKYSVQRPKVFLIINCGLYLVSFVFWWIKLLCRTTERVFVRWLLC
jgi:hypothetical protein